MTKLKVIDQEELKDWVKEIFPKSRSPKRKRPAKKHQNLVQKEN